MSSSSTFHDVPLTDVEEKVYISLLEEYEKIIEWEVYRCVQFYLLQL